MMGIMILYPTGYAEKDNDLSKHDVECFDNPPLRP